MISTSNFYSTKSLRELGGPKPVATMPRVFRALPSRTIDSPTTRGSSDILLTAATDGLLVPSTYRLLRGDSSVICAKYRQWPVSAYPPRLNMGATSTSHGMATGCPHSLFHFLPHSHGRSRRACGSLAGCEKVCFGPYTQRTCNLDSQVNK